MLAMFETYMGGTRPSKSGPFASRRRIISAASTGCRTPGDGMGWDAAQRTVLQSCLLPGDVFVPPHACAWALGPGPIHIHSKQHSTAQPATAPTLPNDPVAPSMHAASHSTAPPALRLLPTPALVKGDS
jgi:hypothetical protein